MYVSIYFHLKMARLWDGGEESTTETNNKLAIDRQWLLAVFTKLSLATKQFTRFSCAHFKTFNVSLVQLPALQFKLSFRKIFKYQKCLNQSHSLLECVQQLILFEIEMYLPFVVKIQNFRFYSFTVVAINRSKSSQRFFEKKTVILNNWKQTKLNWFFFLLQEKCALKWNEFKMKHAFQSSILCNESEFPTYPRPSGTTSRTATAKRNLNWSFVDGSTLTNVSIWC